MGIFLQTIPEDFSLFVKLWFSKTEEDLAQSCPMGLSGETLASDLLKSESVKSRLWWLKKKVWLFLGIEYQKIYKWFWEFIENYTTKFL